MLRKRFVKWQKSERLFRDRISRSYLYEVEYKKPEFRFFGQLNGLTGLLVYF